jgi:ubiquinone/menaquinone biosynthesis C-methylase UbiE
MSMPSADNNELQAAEAFSRQSKKFDGLYGSNTIVQYKRQRVRAHLQQYLTAPCHILELNSGTGEDAIWLAQQGHMVHATDISIGMQEVLLQKIDACHLGEQITTELISFTALEKLNDKRSFDAIFSNFAGLNCTGELKKVLDSFSTLLKNGGIVTLVVLPKFCLWELLLVFKGKFKTAFRRFFSNHGVTAQIENTSFKCWYYNPSYIIKNMQKEFTVMGVEGLCTLVPPSYIEGFAEKHPEVYHFLKTREDRWKSGWPWKYMGDYFIISLKKKGFPPA